jgi:SAM-dependent methyltransferase
MTDGNGANGDVRDADAWDSYWTGGRRAGTFAGGGPQDAVLEAFWRQHFNALLSGGRATARLLDIGAGSGAVTGFALRTARDLLRPLEVTCLDCSGAALSLVAQKHAAVTTLCASAADIPSGDDSFDAVASQFGIEYAGIGAAREAARVLRPGGSLALVLHRRDGAIHRECEGNAEALDATLASGVLPAFGRLMHCACELRAGRGSRDAFEGADRDLAPAVGKLEAVIREHGRDCCAGSLFRLYADIAHMYGRPYNYEANDSEQWVERAGRELRDFRARMQSMLNAALDEAALEDWRSTLEEAGLQLDETRSLHMGEQREPAAWVLTGLRRG